MAELWDIDQRIQVATNIMLKVIRETSSRYVRQDLAIAIQVLQAKASELVNNKREVENALGEKLP